MKGCIGLIIIGVCVVLQGALGSSMRVPCQAYGTGIRKLLATSERTPYFRTNVLTEAAISQLSSYPGTPKQTRALYASVLKVPNAESEKTALSAERCQPELHHQALVKLLESGHHHAFRPHKMTEIRRLALRYLKDETSFPAPSETQLLHFELFKRLCDLKYVESSECTQAETLFDEATKARKELLDSKATLAAELKAMEPLRLRLHPLVQP